MPSQEEILKLKTFCQKITYTPRPLDAQPCKRQGASVWCEDWEIIEILKYLFHGKETYYGDPEPRRLKHNLFFKKENIEALAEAMIAEYKTADAIIAALEKRRGA